MKNISFVLNNADLFDDFDEEFAKTVADEIQEAVHLQKPFISQYKVEKRISPYLQAKSENTLIEARRRRDNFKMQKKE